MKKLVIFLFMLSGSLASSAQIQRGVIIELDTNIILIGEQINMTIEMRCASSDRITFPNLKDTLVKNVEVVSREIPDTSYKNKDLSQKIIKQKLIITSFDTGIYTINPLKATINGDTALTQGFKIGVFTYNVDSTNAITDIKGNIKDPLTFIDYAKAYWHYVALFYGIGTLLALAYFFIKKRNTIPSEEKIKKPTIPAHDLAFQRLLNLENKQLWQNGKFKEYHVRLSEILREYLENRFNILAMEQTTEEILADLKPIRIEKEIRENLEDLMKLTDLVKFAKMQPLDSENQAVMNWSRQIIEKTKLEDNLEEEEIDSNNNIAKEDSE